MFKCSADSPFLNAYSNQVVVFFIFLFMFLKKKKSYHVVWPLAGRRRLQNRAAAASAPRHPQLAGRGDTKANQQ